MKLFTIVKNESSRINKKNFQIIANEVPLWEWTISRLSVNDIEIYVNTDSDQVLSRCEHYSNIIPIKRSQKHIEWEQNSKKCGSPVEDMLVDFCQNKLIDKSELVCLFHVTSPFISMKSILNAAQLLENSDFKSVQSVKIIQDFVFFDRQGNIEPINYDPGLVQRTQDLEPIYMSLGAFFIAKGIDIITSKSRIPKPVFSYCLDARESIEVDYQDQLDLVRILARNEPHGNA